MTEPSPVSVGARVSAARLMRDIGTLAADDMGGRPTPSPQLARAASYIASEMSRVGLESLPGAPGHLQQVSCGGDGPSSNVIGVRRGDDPVLRDEAVVVSAHYDHIGVSADAGPGADAIFNGANDDASGVAAVLEVARALSTEDLRLARTVVFLAFCGEELGLLGSKAYVTQPAWPIESTIAVVNLEMLGHPEPVEPLRAWITGMERSDLARYFRPGHPTSDAAEVVFVDAREIGPTEGSTFDRSDNYPFAVQGVVAHSIATGRLGPLYHSVDDEPDRIDGPRLTRVVGAIAAGIVRLASEPMVPAWTEGGRPSPPPVGLGH